jgi:RNA polymerase sigma-32 factor
VVDPDEKTPPPDEVEEEGSDGDLEAAGDEAPAMATADVEILEADEGDDVDEGEDALVPLDPLQRYLAEARRYPLLSREEEHALAVRYKEHEDLDAAYRLVTANLRLVVMIAREYQRASRNVLDLVQEGNIGLMEAVKRFDPYRGVRFPSYAVWWIRAYIIRYLINNWRMVKLGTTQAQRKLFFNLRKEKERLEREGFSPAPKLIAQRLDVKESEVVEMQQRLAGADVSVDAPTDSEGSATLLDFLPAGGRTEDDVARAEFRALIGEKMREFGDHLKGKEARIFAARLLADEPLTLQDIGDEYGISRERVRQIEQRLKNRLKEYLLAELGDIAEAALQD